LPSPSDGARASAPGRFNHQPITHFHVARIDRLKRHNLTRGTNDELPTDRSRFTAANSIGLLDAMLCEHRK
jgi:hypothetical protein